MNEDLTAAKKTVEVLKQKVVSLYNGGQSSIQRQLELTRRRDEAHRQKAAMMALRNAELERYSATLEQEVSRRTESIKTILNHVSFGFLVVGRDQRVEVEHTRSCCVLLGTEAVAERTLPEVLGLDPRAEAEFSLSLDQVFEDLIPSDVTLAQMRSRFEIGGRVLKIEGSAIRGPDQGVCGILFSIGDVTALEAAQRENHEHRVLIQILRQRDAFRGFVADVEAQLTSAREAEACGDASAVRRHIHTIKGNAGAYELRSVVEVAHAVEEREQIGGADIDRVEAAMRSFLEQHHAILGIDPHSTGEESYEVSRLQLASLASLAAAVPDPQGAAVTQWTREVARRPVGSLLGPIESFVGRLASRLGKRVALEISGGDTAVDVETLRPVVASLTHLIRNAVDHGLEPPEARGDKPSTGRLQIAFGSTPAGWEIRVEDDGKGVNESRLVEKAIARGLLSSAEADGLDSAARLQLMFLDGLSSAEEATEVSGRGVGMSSVLMAVRHSGGDLELRSERGRGTVFLLRIPAPAVPAVVEKDLTPGASIVAPSSPHAATPVPAQPVPTT